MMVNSNAMVSISVGLDGKGTVTGAGMYEYGTEAVLVAKPALVSEFEGWDQNGTLISNDTILTVTADQAYTLTAKFAEIPEVWILNPEKLIATGISPGTTPAEILEYYQDGENSVTVTTPDGQTASKVGTGCLIQIDKITYAVVIVGDVDGDAEISLSDCYAMLEHINGEEILTGPYLEAASISGNEDIDIFDLYDVFFSLSAEG